MRIINASAGPITNFEVYGVLKAEILDLEARAEAFRTDSVGSQDDAQCPTHRRLLGAMLPAGTARRRAGCVAAPAPAVQVPSDG